MPSHHAVEFLRFDDCPNHAAARSLLDDVIAEMAPGTLIRDIDATDPDVAREVRFPGSPMIRVDGQDVDPGFVDPGEYTPHRRAFWTPDGLRCVPAGAWIEVALRG